MDKALCQHDVALDNELDASPSEDDDSCGFVSSEHAPDVPMPSWHSQQLQEDMQKQKRKMLEKLHPVCKRMKTLTLGASSGVTRACHEPEQESVGWGQDSSPTRARSKALFVIDEFFLTDSFENIAACYHIGWQEGTDQGGSTVDELDDSVVGRPNEPGELIQLGSQFPSPASQQDDIQGHSPLPRQTMVLPETSTRSSAHTILDPPSSAELPHPPKRWAMMDAS